jgi:S1-C subfamily serine protease
VEEDSPAARAGLKEGDYLLAIDNQPTSGTDDVVRLLDGDKIDTDVEILLFSVAGRIERRTVRPTHRPKSP